MPPPQHLGVTQHTALLGLNIATHNVRGLKDSDHSSKLRILADIYTRSSLDIVFLQETHMTDSACDAWQAQLGAACHQIANQHKGYKCLWGHNTANTRSAGVAILISNNKLSSGDIRVDEHTLVAEEGRLVSVVVEWGGHKLRLANVYFPNVPVAQRAFIDNKLGPLWQQWHNTAANSSDHQHGPAVPTLVWGGDWNFLEDTQLDKINAATQATMASAVLQSHPPVATHLHQLIPNMCDAFRHLHPTRRCYTWFGPTTATRLDRIYLEHTMVPYLLRTHVLAATPSDHRVFVCQIARRVAAQTGPGLRRVRPANFWEDSTARAQLLGFMQQEADAAPQNDDQALVQWWPAFKGRLVAKCNQLATQVRQQHQATPPAVQRRAAEDALQAAYHAVEISIPATLQAAMQQLQQARMQWRSVVNAQQQQQTWRTRKEWIHKGERPAPGLTAAIARRQPLQARYIPPMQSPATGAWVTARPQAQVVAHYWARISAAPVVDSTAQAQVLHAVSSSGLTLNDSDATLIGETDITTVEVKKALKHSKPGKAPGLDGIPVELYRRCSDIITPLLARLYTAIARAQQLPAGFLDGVISTIHKAGDHAQLGNYRPITLLSTDYRILAKVLAYRLRQVQAKIIAPEQTAFIPGRLIGENVMLNQLLPHALPRDSEAIEVFCDFRKAYDTVSRQFLFQLLHTMGVGGADGSGGFLKWVKLLLSDTYSCAVVNGHISDSVRFTAGVRQGCPLAPQLYLFVAQALLCYLKHEHIGIDVTSTLHLTATQFADDAQVFLSSWAEIPRFLTCMDTFAAASGQHLNVHKSNILPVGRAARLHLWIQHYLQQNQSMQHAMTAAQAQLQQDDNAIPANSTCQGLAVVQEAKALGLVFRTDGSTSVDWQSRMHGVEIKYASIAKLPLSVFGRGFASASYGVSKLLYHAEFAGMPPPAIIAQLEKFTAKLVDRAQAPHDTQRKFSGVAGTLLPGHPKAGGFGALPWRQHIQARHAVWAARLLHDRSDKPWLMVARHMLHSNQLRMLVASSHITPMPAPLHRLTAAMQTLPPVAQVVTQAPSGAWMAACPLWHNPMLLVSTGASIAFPQRQGLEIPFADLARLGTINTIAQAMAARNDVQQALQHHTYGQVQASWLANSNAFADGQHALQRLNALLHTIHPDWLNAVAVATAAQPVQLDISKAACEVAVRMGWLQDTGPPVMLHTLTVKAATDMLCKPMQAERQQRHQAFLAEACSGLPTNQHASIQDLQLLLQRLWKVKWDNQRKELFWRLVVNGLPTAQRMHMTGQPCTCGYHMPDRKHHFWDCPVAMRIRQLIQAALPANVQLQCHHVWLARVPCNNIHAGVWLVVCQAALLAMQSGKKLLVSWQLDEDSRPAHLPGDVQLDIVAKLATAMFWDMLQDFAALALYPAAWLQQVSSQHPFLCVQQSMQGTSELHLHRHQ
jgi:exonuclease III